MERRTPLYECHEHAGGKIVPFAGYLLPVQYKTGVIAEHMAVRTACGLFDVSHMGEVVVKGADALDNLQRLFTNDMSGMQNGRVRYSPMCNESGGVVDDLIAYKLSDACYLVVVNAANREKDVAWMRAHLQGDVALTDISDGVAQLALQGPKAQEALASLDARLADCALDAEALAEAEDASISLTEDQKQEIADIRADASLPSDQKRAAIYRLLVGSVTLTEVDLSLAEGGETEAALAYFSLPAGEDRLLEVSLSLSGDPEASERYRVTRYQLVSTKEWEEEDPGLWTGPEGQIGEVIE